MELGLNLLWLAISGCALVYWLTLPAWNRNIISRARSIGVLACLLVMLFPSVSITDDLQAASDAVEDRALSVRKVQDIPLAQFIVAPPPIDAPAQSAQSLVVISWLSAEKDPVAHPGSLPTSGWRAPPIA